MITMKRAGTTETRAGWAADRRCTRLLPDADRERRRERARLRDQRQQAQARTRAEEPDLSFTDKAAAQLAVPQAPTRQRGAHLRLVVDNERAPPSR
jgi:hypothetical protein